MVLFSFTIVVVSKVDFDELQYMVEYPWVVWTNRSYGIFISNILNGQFELPGENVLNKFWYE